MEKDKELFTMKETSDMTGLSNDLLRIYEEEFNLQIERTAGKHRRYTKKDVELFLTIKKKIQEQNWSYKQVRSWLNGDELALFTEETEVKSNLEKKLDRILDFHEKQEDFNEALVKQLHVFSNELIETKLQLAATTEKNENLQQYLEGKLEERNQVLLEAITESRKEKHQSKKPFWKFWG